MVQLNLKSFVRTQTKARYTQLVITQNVLIKKLNKQIMQAQTKLINQKAEEFLKKFVHLVAEKFKINDEEFESLRGSILEVASMKLHGFTGISVLNLSIDPYLGILGWDNETLSEPFGSFYDDWLLVNFETKEIEVRSPNFYLDLFYKVALNEKLFMEIFLKAAQILFNYGNERNWFENKLMIGLNIYERRRLAEEFADSAGGDKYFEFWKQFWTAWSDEEILEAGPIGYYNLDLPEGIILEGDKFVKVK